MASLRKIKNYAFNHKVMSIIIAIVLLFGIYKVYGYFTNTSSDPRYVIAAVQKGTILSTVSGSGQVSASSQVDITPKASGDITYVGVTSGQTVSAGQLIAQIDSQSASLDLENTKLALAKLTEPADKLSVAQADNALTSAEEAKVQASSDLAKSYNDGFSNVSAAFTDFSTVMTGLDNLFNASGGSYYFSEDKMLGDTSRSYRTTASNSYWAAKRAYNQNITDYQLINRQSASSSVEAIIAETSQTAQLMSQAIKDTNTSINFIYVNTQQSSRLGGITTDLNNLASWSAKISADSISLTTNNNTIKSAHDTLSGSDRSITEKAYALEKLKNGPDALDVRAQQLAVQQKELSYANYFVRAPFDGVIAKVDVQKADTVGGSTVVATLITNKKIANVSLNEVDAAKIKVGQKATLTFDAVPELSIAGEVSEVDLVGAVTQGVVNYNVKIAFDTQDSRIRSGMSADAAIATAVRQDVLVVSSGAVKTQGNSSYVQLLDQSLPVTDSKGIISATLPTQQVVQVGISDDTNTEIVSGLKEGEKIVTRTINPTTATKTATAPSLIGGGGRVGGGARGG